MSLARRVLDRIAVRLPGGPDGNRRLTAVLGALLLVGTTAELGTLMLGLQRTLSLHIAIGVALIPVVALKLASTGWRMLRYYTHAATYRREGPPRPFLRAIAPLVVGSTVALLGSGVGLILVGPKAQYFRSVHGASFALFLILVGVHAVAHLPKIRRFALADWITGRPMDGQLVRRSAVTFAVITGGALAVAALQSAGPWVTAMQHGVGG
jgi:hypothetical protein